MQAVPRPKRIVAVYDYKKMQENRSIVANVDKKNAVIKFEMPELEYIYEFLDNSESPNRQIQEGDELIIFYETDKEKNDCKKILKTHQKKVKFSFEFFNDEAEYTKRLKDLTTQSGDYPGDAKDPASYDGGQPSSTSVYDGGQTLQVNGLPSSKTETQSEDQKKAARAAKFRKVYEYLVNVEREAGIWYDNTRIELIPNSEIKSTHPTEFSTKISFLNEDCIEITRRKIDEGNSVIVLSAANSQDPGGGVEQGEPTQEEHICRESSLILSIKKAKEYNFYPFKEFSGVFSPYVVLVNQKENKIEVGENTFSVISVAGYRCGEKRSYIPGQPSVKDYPGQKEFLERMKKKARLILQAAITQDKNGLPNRETGEYRKKTLILAAIGCGVFANGDDRKEILHVKDDVSRAFSEVLLQEKIHGELYANYFDEIIFAIKETKEQRLMPVFKKAFGVKDGEDFITVENKTKEEKQKLAKLLKEHSEANIKEKFKTANQISDAIKKVFEIDIDASVLYDTSKFELDSKNLNILSYNPKISVVNQDTVSAAREMIKKHQKALILNFANDENPGGGFKRGAPQQEEEVCRKTTLFKSLKKENYPFNYLSLIYTPNVAIFPENIQDEIQVCSAITMAAIRAYLKEETKTGNHYPGQEKYKDVTKQKIRGIFNIAIHEKHTNLVLGAFGCGAFADGKDHIPKDVAKAFRDVLDEKVKGSSRKYKSFFENIVFAVLDKDGGKNITAFEDVFKKNTSNTQKASAYNGGVPLPSYTEESVEKFTDKNTEKIENPLFFEDSIISVKEEGTLDGARALLTNEEDRVLALNFANQYGPGGAQEGYLTHNSTLNESLANAQKLNLYKIEKNEGLYSPYVKIKENGKETDKIISIISMAAYDHSFSSYESSENEEDLKTKMRPMIELMLNKAIKEGHNKLVLGAFGCGIFAGGRKYVPHAVASVFKEVLESKYNDDQTYLQCFEEVRFSILKDGKDGSNLQIFQNVFKDYKENSQTTLGLGLGLNANQSSKKQLKPNNLQVETTLDSEPNLTSENKNDAIVQKESVLEKMFVGINISKEFDYLFINCTITGNSKLKINSTVALGGVFKKDDFKVFVGGCFGVFNNKIYGLVAVDYKIIKIIFEKSATDLNVGLFIKAYAEKFDLSIGATYLNEKN